MHLLLLFWVLGYSVFSGGISGVVFTDIVYKTVPKEKEEPILHGGQLGAV